MGVIIQVYSIEFWVIKSYHPLRDTSFIFVLLGTWIFCTIIEELCKLIGLRIHLW